MRFKNRVLQKLTNKSHKSEIYYPTLVKEIEYQPMIGREM